jgi:hypothetical protein
VAATVTAATKVPPRAKLSTGYSQVIHSCWHPVDILWIIFRADKSYPQVFHRFIHMALRSPEKPVVRCFQK